MIEKAEALGDPPEDPLLLFSILYGFWATNYVGHNGDALLELASQFLALAEKQSATGPLVIAHRLMGSSLSTTGELVGGRTRLDKAIALYDRAEHSLLATRFGQDVGVVILSWQSWTVWVLGYPEAALADVELRRQKRTRDWTRTHIDLCALLRIIYACLLWKLRDRKSALLRTRRFG